MKNFLDHLVEVQKTYEFRIKIANIDPTESMDKLESALNAYGLESLSKPKRLPIKEGDVDFPSVKNCQLYLMDVVLTYPVNDAQLRAIIAERAGYPAGSIVVVPKNHPEEIWRWNESGESEIREFVKGEAVLDKPLEEVKGGKEAGKAYSEAGSLLKELNKAKVEIAGGETPAAKTTNDLPTGDASPVGSNQNKISSAK
jgi:hypothetical protein